ncbi:MAG: type 1 glutamine amidotransferase [Actinobacteria bacterium]|nr:type 1 glutamine amidotransferase [Actinomycetota bacterium]
MPDRPLLVVRHAPWEGPHRIIDAFDGIPLQVVDFLEPGSVLPPHHAVRGAVLMGGPMSVNDTDHHPGIAAEIAWVRHGLALGTPMLGICLGSQVIARAAGSQVAPGPRPEIGWLPVEVADPRDPVLGPLAPMTVTLHWHGEAFGLPEGATALARSGITPVQAFRTGNAWGVLFHPEADAALVDSWLAEPVMRAEAEAVIGPDADAALRHGAARHSGALVDRSARGFAAFAALTR